VKLSRRQMFTALGLGLLGASLPVSLGCASHDAASKPAGPRRIEKTIHLACKGREPLLAHVTHIELRVGTKRFRSQLHSAETRKKAMAGTPTEQHALVGAATHFFTEVEISSEAPQNLAAFAVFADGHERLYAASIHVPVAADRLRSTDDSDDPTDPDPHDFMTDEGCALWAVFNTPSLMTHDSDMARAILDEITRAPTFAALTSAISRFPNVIDPTGPTPSPDCKPIDAGWVHGCYRYFRIGKAPPVAATRVRLDGSEVLDAAGNPQVVVDWRLSEDTYGAVQPVSVRALADSVSRDVQAAFQNNPGTYQGIKYFTYPGVSIQPSTPAGSAGVGADAAGYHFSAEGMTKHHRKLSVTPQGGGFKATLVNALALGTLLGVSHFDPNGAEVETHILGYASATYYPSLTRLLGPSTVEGTFDRPAGALTSNLWTISSAISHGDYGPNGEKVHYTSRALFAWILGTFTDFVVPGLFLALGLPTAEHTRDELVTEVLTGTAESAIESAIDVVTSLVSGIYDWSKAGSVSQLLEDFGADFMKICVRFVEKALLQSPAYATALTQILGEAMLERSLELATPLVGWAVYAADVATSGVQLGVSTEHFFSNQIFTSGVVSYTHPLDVALAPQDSTYFPSGIAYYKATISSAKGEANFTPIQTVGQFRPSADKTGIESFAFELPDIPILVPFTLQVILYDRDPNGTTRAIARGTLLVERTDNVTSPGQKQSVSFSIATPPLPIGEATQLVHDVVLAPSGSGFAWSAAGAPPPAGDANPYSCQSGALCGVAALHVRQNSTQAGRVAFDFSTSTGNGPGSVIAGVAMPASRPARPTAVSVNANAPRAVGMQRLVMSLAGPSVVLSQTTTERVRVYLVPDDGSDFDAGQWQESAANLYITARSNRVEAARLSPDGSYLLLALGDAVEVIPITRRASTPSDDRPRYSIVRPGVTAGCLSLPVAAAGFHHEAQLAVLDAGLARVSVFDYPGQFIPYFQNGTGYLDLNTSDRQNRVPLDIEVDAIGEVWVLARAQDFSRYYLEVYDRTGGQLTAFTELQADRFALDRFNQVFTLNRQVLAGPNGPTPTVSRWYPQNP
jgi:hypothetical protein